MPGNSATVSIAIEVDDKGSVKIRQLGEAARKAGDEGARGFEAMGKSAGAIESGVNTATASMRSLIGVAAGVAGAVAAISVGNQFLQTAKDFERFNAQLTTLKGSSEEAKKALDWMTDFAAKTPYALNQVVEAFVKLESYGLSGTRWMQTLGDTAAAMGKPLSQAVEAVADAVTGEFERLKEFGVRTKQEGDSVTFSWTQNGEQMTASTAKTSEGIQQALERIFSRFDGQMVLMSSTWEGMMSNLGDWWSNFQRQVMDSGLFDSLKRQLAGVLVTLDQLKKDGTMDKMAKDVANLAQLILDALPAAFKVVITGIDLVGKAFLGWQVIWNGLAHVFTALVGGIIAGFNAMITQMRLGFADFITTVSSSWAKVQSAVLSVDGGAIAGGSGLDIAALRAEELDSKLAKLQQTAASAKAEIMASGAAGQKTADEWLASADKYGAAFTKSVDATIAWDNSMKGIKSAVEAYSASVDASKAKVAGMADGMGKAGDAADTAGRQTEELATQTDKATKAAKDKEKAAKDLAKTFADTHSDMIADVNAWVAKQDEGKAALAETEEAYKDLGLTSKASYEAQVKAAVDAYKLIANAAGTSDAERARLREALQARLIELEDDYRGKVGETAGAITQIWTDLTDDTKQVLSDWVEHAIKAEFDNIGEAFESLAKAMLDVWIDMIAKMIAEWVGSGLLGLVTGEGFGGFLSAGGSVIGKGLDKLLGGGAGQAMDWGLNALGGSALVSGGASLLGSGGPLGIGSALGVGGGVSAGAAALFPSVFDGTAATLFGEQAAAGFVGSLDTAMAGGLEWAAIPGKEFFGTGASQTAAAGGAGIGTAAAFGGMAAFAGGLYALASMTATPWQSITSPTLGIGVDMPIHGGYGESDARRRASTLLDIESGLYDPTAGGGGDTIGMSSLAGFDLKPIIEDAKGLLDILANQWGDGLAKLALDLDGSVAATDRMIDAAAGYDVSLQTSAELNRLASEAVGGSSTAMDSLRATLQSLGLSEEQTETAMLGLIAATGSSTGKVRALAAVLQSQGMSASAAQSTAQSLVSAMQSQSSSASSAAGAISGMVSNIRTLSNTPLNIRVNVGVREQPYRIENHNPYAVHASGGIFASPTLIPSVRGTRHLVGEAGAEAIMPLHAGPKTLELMDRKLDALAARPMVVNINGDAAGIARFVRVEVDRMMTSKSERRVAAKRVTF